MIPYRTPAPPPSAGCPECLRIVRALSSTAPLTDLGSQPNYGRSACDHCGAECDTYARDMPVHGDGCIWQRAELHAAWHESKKGPPSALHLYDVVREAAEKADDELSRVKLAKDDVGGFTRGKLTGRALALEWVRCIVDRFVKGEKL